MDEPVNGVSYWSILLSVPRGHAQMIQLLAFSWLPTGKDIVARLVLQIKNGQLFGNNPPFYLFFLYKPHIPLDCDLTDIGLKSYIPS